MVGDTATHDEGRTASALSQSPPDAHKAMNESADIEDEEEPIVAFCREQRAAGPGEPTCVVCGRFGAYVCDATDEDVCSLECRDVCRQRVKTPADTTSPQSPDQDAVAKLNESLERGDATHESFADASEVMEELRRRLRVRVDLHRPTPRVAPALPQTSPPPPPPPPGPPPLLVDFAMLEARLPRQLWENMQSRGMCHPTPIQMQAIPLLLPPTTAERPSSPSPPMIVVLQAPTGTGKSAAFLVPLVVELVESPCAVGLVLAPLRELASQIEDEAKQLLRGLPDMRTALVVGGVPRPQQRHRLQQAGVRLVVATPGRLLELLREDAIPALLLSCVQRIVIDELDVMLGTGFGGQVQALLDALRRLRQGISQRTEVELEPMRIVLTSATLPGDLARCLEQVLGAKEDDDAVLQGGFYLVCAGDTMDLDAGHARNDAPSIARHDRIRQRILWAEEKAKKSALFKILRETVEPEQQTLVFVDSQAGADLLAQAITKTVPGCVAASFHAGKPQHQRYEALEALVQGRVRVIVATHGLGRGLDLLPVRTVVVFDAPRAIADYVHLIGRVARTEGETGDAFLLVNDRDQELFPELIAICRRTTPGAKATQRIHLPAEVFARVRTRARNVEMGRTSASVALDESKRAFHIRQQVDSGIEATAEGWKSWNEYRTPKRQRTRW